MKSIMEEASTVTKAIENAWVRAGKPIEFRIRIFQDSEKNLFGFTKKSAKIALFFSEKDTIFEPSVPPQPPQKSAPTQSTQQQPQRATMRPLPQQQQKPVPITQYPETQEHQKKKYVGWTDPMIDVSKKWISNTLRLIGLPNVDFQMEASGNNLIIKFATPLTGQDSKERLLYSSFAHLILTTMRHQFRKQFPRHKVIIKS